MQDLTNALRVRKACTFLIGAVYLLGKPDLDVEDVEGLKEVVEVTFADASWHPFVGYSHLSNFVLYSTHEWYLAWLLVRAEI